MLSTEVPGGTHEFGVGAEQAPAHMEHWRHAAAAAAMAATPSGPSSRSSSSCSSSSPSEHGDSRDAALDGQKVYLPFKGVADPSPLSPPPKRERFSYTRYQLELLNNIYTEVRYPNSTQKQLIAKRVGITRDQVKIWFQNRRRKDITGPKTGKPAMDDSPKGPSMVPKHVMQCVLHELVSYNKEPQRQKNKRNRSKSKSAAAQHSPLGSSGGTRGFQHNERLDILRGLGHGDEDFMAPNKVAPPPPPINRMVPPPNQTAPTDMQNELHHALMRYPHMMPPEAFAAFNYLSNTPSPHEGALPMYLPTGNPYPSPPTDLSTSNSTDGDITTTPVSSSHNYKELYVETASSAPYRGGSESTDGAVFPTSQPSGEGLLTCAVENTNSSPENSSYTHEDSSDGTNSQSALSVKNEDNESRDGTSIGEASKSAINLDRVFPFPFVTEPHGQLPHGYPGHPASFPTSQKPPGAYFDPYQTPMGHFPNPYYHAYSNGWYGQQPGVPNM